MLDFSNLDTRLSKLMHQVPRLSLQNTVREAASLMFEYRTRSMPVYQGTRLVGQVTSPAIVGRMMESDVPVQALLDNDQGTPYDRVERDPLPRRGS